MKKYSFGIILLLMLGWGCESTVLRNAQEESFEMTSTNTGRNYRMDILLPPDYDASQTYPSVYLLDGHWHYLNVAADAQQLMRNDRIRDVIIIGIAYADFATNTLGGFGEISSLRIDDLTAQKNSDEAERGGDAANFRKFIVEELIPEIDTRYSTGDAERTLMGHSLGGYFGLWEMFNFTENSPFDYIESGSPALWWADGFLMDMEEQVANAGSRLPFRLHTTMGTLESVVWNAFFDEFEERLGTNGYDDLTYIFERYPRGHSAMAETGFKEGLKYFFGN
ncbi:MAG: alpha/beta hydrolase-fold protein [Bacteroidota bacterium]